MSSDLFHSDLPRATVMSSEDVPPVVKSEPFSPLPDVSLNTIFPQQPIQRSFSSGAYVYHNPWFSLQPRYVGYIRHNTISRYSLVNLANIRTERCSAEERKLKIIKYRAKRHLRNFRRTIRYVCRKTVAGSMPRGVQGRFAPKEEVRGIPGLAAHKNGDDALVKKEED